MATTLTLAQYAMLEKQPLKKGVMLGLAQEGVVADLFPWRSLGGALSETGVRYDEVISPDWVTIGGTIASKSAQGKQLSFSVHKLAVHIDIPVELEDNNADQLERASARQGKLAIKGAAYALNDAFINGDQASDGNQMEGLNKMVASLDPAQTVGATEIDLTASYTDALAESLWFRLDQGIAQIDGHEPTAGFANRQTLTRIRSFMRQNKMMGVDFAWADMKFNIDDPRRTNSTASTRPAFLYQGIPMYDLGRKADQTTQVMLNTYTEGGSTAAGSRIFFVKQNDLNLEGISAGPLEIKDIGLLEATDVVRKRLTWLPGLANWGPRGIVKVQGLKVI